MLTSSFRAFITNQLNKAYAWTNVWGTFWNKKTFTITFLHKRGKIWGIKYSYFARRHVRLKSAFVQNMNIWYILAQNYDFISHLKLKTLAESLLYITTSNIIWIMLFSIRRNNVCCVFTILYKQGYESFRCVFHNGSENIS